MNQTPRYKEVREIEDPDDVNKLIDGGGWDLLHVIRRARLDEPHAERAVYVVGKRTE